MASSPAQAAKLVLCSVLELQSKECGRTQLKLHVDAAPDVMEAVLKGHFARPTVLLRCVVRPIPVHTKRLFWIL